MLIQTFERAQAGVLERYGIEARSRFVEAPVVDGMAHVLVCGEGPAVVMINGIGTPAAMWAPLMAHLGGFAVHAIDLPGFGLTDTSARLTEDYRSTAVTFLEQVLDSLGFDRPMFVSNSLGSLWTIWLAIDRAERVAAVTHVGCPALVLGTSAPLPMRMLSVPAIASVMMKLQPPSPRQVMQLSKVVNQHPLDPHIAEVLLATERLPGFEKTLLSTLHTLLRLRGARSDMALCADDLRQVTQSTQLIWGTDDPMGSPAVARDVASIMNDVELHLVEGGHTPWLTEAGAIGPLVARFLSRQEGLRA